MCGLTGIIFGKKTRSKSELLFLKDLFTSMFIMSESRGHHASGLVSLDITGKSTLYKLPVCPSRMVLLQGYRSVLNTLSNKTSVLLGHSRWRTVGSEHNNKNNQPLIIGSVLGTHNGTILNASSLFEQFALKRMAQVDSEVLFRMADCSLIEGSLNTSLYKRYLAQCEGNLSFVLVSRRDPEHVFIFKGDKPLSLFYNMDLRVIVYSSLDRYIINSLPCMDGWYALFLEDNHILSTSFNDFNTLITEPFYYRKRTTIKKAKIPKIKGIPFIEF